ncbi:MAG: hypothetical protein KAU14_00500 [Thermoplasmata archaeon]|nr:hypothetical protein [Thermoplasmata archaeon]
MKPETKEVEKTSKTIEIEPKEFWDDMRWGRKHYQELIEKYPDKWVAIVGKTVIAVGDGIKQVRRVALQKTEREHIVTLFVECGDHVY